jgi:hypothetical protein
MNRTITHIVAAWAALAGFAGVALAGDDDIHLPADSKAASFMWTVADEAGGRWDISNNGVVSDGTDDAYDGGMLLQVNGSSYPGYSTGRLSADGKEVEVGPWLNQGLSISRRVFVNAKSGYCRWIDIFENTTSADIGAAVQYYSNMGDSTATVHSTSGGEDVAEKDWGAVTWGAAGSNRPAIVHIYGARGSKAKPAFQYTRGSDDIRYVMQLKVPAGQAVALCMFQAQRKPYAAAVKFLDDFKVANELGLVPPGLRKIIVNMTGPVTQSGQTNLIRNDQADLVTTTGGDEIQGKIANKDYALKTVFGEVTIPAEKVLGLTAAARDKDRVNLVLADGQVVLGDWTNGPLLITPADGVEKKVAGRALKQAGYRITAGRPEQTSGSDPLVVLRDGQRLALDPAKLALEFQSAYGKIKLPADAILSVELDAAKGGLHQANFRNGSSLAGLLADDKPSFKLTLGATLATSASAIARLVFAADADQPAGKGSLAGIVLKNGDTVYGSFTDAKWSVANKVAGNAAVEIPTADIASAEFGEALGAVKVTLRDRSTISGKLSGDYVGFKIEPGPDLKLFVGHLVSAQGAPTANDATSRPATLPAATAEALPETENELKDLIRQIQTEHSALVRKVADSRQRLGADAAETKDLQAQDAKLRERLSAATAALRKFRGGPTPPPTVEPDSPSAPVPSPGPRPPGVAED